MSLIKATFTSSRPAVRSSRDGGRTRLSLILLMGLAVVIAVSIGLRWRQVSFATLAVTSDPPGAATLIDGVYHGITPCEATPLAPGKHKLKLTKHGFEPYAAAIKLKRGKTTHHAGLAPEKRFDLLVTSDPPGATVSLEGDELLQKTPTQIRDLAPRKYEIRVTARGYLAFRQEIEVGPNGPGTFAARLQSKTEAYYLDVIKKNPAMISNYTELAHHYVIANQFDEAGRIVKKALEIACAPDADRNDVSRLHQEIETIYYGTFDFGGEEALARARPIVESVLRETIKDHPAVFAPYHLLGTMLLNVGKFQEAEGVLTEGLKNMPGDPSLRLVLAKVLQRQQKFDQAAARLEEVLAVEQDHVEARSMLAEVYQQLGKIDLAIKHRERVAALGQSDPAAAIGALASLAGLYHRQGDLNKAAACWEKAAGLQNEIPLRAQYQMAAANEHAQAGNLDRAVALWQEVVKTSTDEALKSQAQQQIQEAQKQKK